MVHTTFYNLSDEKQRRIIDAARCEFLAHPFEKSSINRILEDAKVPKGSFYQYFDGKEDLFYVCIAEVAKKLIALRKEHQQTLLDTGLLRTQEMGYDAGTEIYKQEVMGYLSKDDLDLYQRLIDSPASVRNYLQMELSATVLAPQVAEELAEHESVRKDIDLNYYAYLISMSEMLAMDYGVRVGTDSIGMLELSYDYLSALYANIRKPDEKKENPS